MVTQVRREGKWSAGRRSVVREMEMSRDGDIAADMAALSRIEQRFAGTEDERRMLDAVRARLPEGVDARVEGFHRRGEQ